MSFQPFHPAGILTAGMDWSSAWGGVRLLPVSLIQVSRATALDGQHKPDGQNAGLQYLLWYRYHRDLKLSLLQHHNSLAMQYHSLLLLLIFVSWWWECCAGSWTSSAEQQHPAGCGPWSGSGMAGSTALGHPELWLLVLSDTCGRPGRIKICWENQKGRTPLIMRHVKWWQPHLRRPPTALPPPLGQLLGLAPWGNAQPEPHNPYLTPQCKIKPPCCKSKEEGTAGAQLGGGWWGKRALHEQDWRVQGLLVDQWLFWTSITAKSLLSSLSLPCPDFNTLLFVFLPLLHLDLCSALHLPLGISKHLGWHPG